MINKKLSLKEFVDSGLLQEVNRRFFHPIGFSLALSKDQNGELHFEGVFDCRDSKHGILFEEISHYLMGKVDIMHSIKKEHRSKLNCCDDYGVQNTTGLIDS